MNEISWKYLEGILSNLNWLDLGGQRSIPEKNVCILKLHWLAEAHNCCMEILVFKQTYVIVPGSLGLLMSVLKGPSCADKTGLCLQSKFSCEIGRRCLKCHRQQQQLQPPFRRNDCSRKQNPVGVAISGKHSAISPVLNPPSPGEKKNCGRHHHFSCCQHTYIFQQQKKTISTEAWQNSWEKRWKGWGSCYSFSICNLNISVLQ